LPLKFYDIYGFGLSVEGPAENVLDARYSEFRVSDTLDRVDLFVKVHEGVDDLPTRPNGALKGMWIPFLSNDNTLWYEKQADFEFLSHFVDGLIWWQDKALLHAGGVAKLDEAFLFVGGGNVGKTSTVINLVEKGYDFIGDDWVVLETTQVRPLWRTLHIHDYNLSNPKRARAILGMRAPVYRAISWMLRVGMDRIPQRHLRYVLSSIRDHQLVVNIDLQKINPEARLARPARIAKIFYLERSNSTNISVTTDIAADQLARRMAYVYLYEWNFLFEEHNKYAYRYGDTGGRLESRFDQIVSIAQTAFIGSQLLRVAIPNKLDLTDIDLVSKLGLP